MDSKGKVHELVRTGDNKRTHWLEIPLGRAGLLLKLLSLSSFHSMCAFLFRARSTLSLWGPSTEDSSFCVDTFLFGTRLLLLHSRTKYQISHTVGRHDLGRAPLPASKYSSCPPHWGYPGAAQVPLTFYLQKTPCHTTCPLDITL